jgi:hypothetical protein
VEDIDDHQNDEFCNPRKDFKEKDEPKGKKRHKVKPLFIV